MLAQPLAYLRRGVEALPQPTTAEGHLASGPVLYAAIAKRVWGAVRCCKGALRCCKGVSGVTAWVGEALSAHSTRKLLWLYLLWLYLLWLYLLWLYSTATWKVFLSSQLWKGSRCSA